MPTIEELWWSKYMVMLHEGKDLDQVSNAMLDEFRVASPKVASLKFMPTEEMSRTIHGMSQETLCRGCTEGIYPTDEGQREYQRQLHQILPYQ